MFGPRHIPLWTFATLAASLSFAVGCVSPTNPVTPLDDAGGLPPEDAAFDVSPEDDAGSSDVQTRDARVPDASEPDATQVVEAGDAGPVDAADAEVADAADAEVADAADAEVADAADAAPLLALLTISDGPTFDFLTVVDGTSAAHTFTVSSTGGGAATALAPLTLDAPFSYAGGAYPGTGGTCAGSLAASATCTIAVTFAPTSPTLATGSLTLGYSDGVATQSASVAIQGTGETPALVTISDGPMFNYGTDADGTSNDHTFTITNSGQAPATATLFAALAAPFSVKSTTCPTAPPTLPGGTPCNLVVTFSPTTQTTSNATLTLGYDDGVTSQTAQRPIQGTGGPVQCAVDVAGNYYIRASGTVAYYNGTTSEVLVAATGLPLEPVSQVFIEPSGACALRSSDQTVWCWATSGGNNTDGELGNGTLTDVTIYFSATQVEISAPDGGPTVYLDDVTSLPTGSSVGAGGIATTGTCAIRGDKSLWCWGPNNGGGAMWEGTTGSSADLVFATQMKVILDGGPDSGDAGDEEGGPGFENVDQVSMGTRHGCFLSAGAVYCWGNNTSGQLGTGDTTTQVNPFQVISGLPDAGGITSITAGEDQSCVLASGQVYCWGADQYSANGDPFVVPEICNSNHCNPLPVPVQVALPDGGANEAPLTGMQTLHGGDAFSCAFDVTGTLYCWGQYSGTPQITPEATLFDNLSGAPSGPIAHLTSVGGAYGVSPTALRYITTSGALVNGSQIVTQVCP